MSYVHVTRTPGQTLDDYAEVARELGPEPFAGSLGHHVGIVDGALVVVDVWESRAHADRFTAERLFPAFERTGRGAGPATDVTAFEPVLPGGAR